MFSQIAIPGIYFKLKLTLQETIVKVLPTVPTALKKRNGFDDQIIQSVSNELLSDNAERKFASDGVPHGVMFLRLDCDSDKMEDKVRIRLQRVCEKISSKSIISFMF